MSRRHHGGRSSRPNHGPRSADPRRAPDVPASSIDGGAVRPDRPVAAEPQRSAPAMTPGPESAPAVLSPDEASAPSRAVVEPGDGLASPIATVTGHDGAGPIDGHGQAARDARG